MMIRRAFYYWQFIAVLVLPVWVLIARGIYGSSVGWDFVLFLILCPILAFALLAIAGLTVARKSVRDSKSVSWIDAGLLTVWHAAIIIYGFVDAPFPAALIVIVAIAAFWIALWQLVTETRNRFTSLVEGFERDAQRPTHPGEKLDNGRVIILEPDENGNFD
ncbi:MFS transporter [Salinibacterium sp. NSLL150]|uniref:MFS transporter n=1 Tax=unclassified Salinibacterium TaxID=2632331 RepID=UPI0018CE8289|nr:MULTISPECIES: MFS transporter [unclassified Salinibacterium]MBH0023706.1 MFS transporter [Salinibacterium sp. SWN248]MBH0098667.1 MFS transporter [Salinibacterium sp. NSLL35]MBH0101422.1 MFS transporter [Salinibacterium sp. NSLL150]MBH0104181.1 MFS transporter [Salinibacterium sp. NSLL16]MBH0106942.1 MFS transporter [Salinibacterium sp. NSLL17]